MSSGVPKLYILAIRGRHLKGFINGCTQYPPEFIEDSDEVSFVRMTNPDYIIWKLQNQLILSWLLSSMTKGILGHVIGHSTSLAVRYALKQVFSSQSRARLMQLRSTWHTASKRATRIADYVFPNEEYR